MPINLLDNNSSNKKQESIFSRVNLSVDPPATHQLKNGSNRRHDKISSGFDGEIKKLILAFAKGYHKNKLFTLKIKKLAGKNKFCAYQVCPTKISQ